MQRSTSQSLEAPPIAGYPLVGNAARSLSSEHMDPGDRTVQRPLVWLYVGDRPTAAGKDTVQVLR